jgi:hypothetical protein
MRQNEKKEKLCNRFPGKNRCLKKIKAGNCPVKGDINEFKEKIKNCESRRVCW